MDVAPILGLDQFRLHLEELQQNQEVVPDATLIDDISIQLTDYNTPPLLPWMLPALANVLRSTQHDAGALFQITVKLTKSLDFTTCLGLADEETMLTMLDSPVDGANLLALHIIHKAANDPNDASILAERPVVFERLVRRWLQAPSTRVASHAEQVLGDLLEVDCSIPIVNGSSLPRQHQVVTPPMRRRHGEVGHDELWNIFFSNQVLSLIKTTCGQSENDARNLSDITIAQGRVLRLLPRLASFNLHAVSDTSHAQVFPLPDAVAEAVGCGLLQWATLGMIDQTDELMERTLVDFFEQLVLNMRDHTRRAGDQTILKKLVRTTTQTDPRIMSALKSLPQNVEEEDEERTRVFIEQLLD
ncbi:hypothetical protein B0I35DRAFT_407336 [Stachybotrys elegans]|uniref:DNA mismatch repair protein HSM3 N-terminal domain-containing protein n=1 Tax=Stachybotrys elegans TaxID=80388 RepID=A0A8K0SXI9_9HYPO|nr:hypothetical protein B0I35DRAFT_407336 [Stachybotrys elegans]